MNEGWHQEAPDMWVLGDYLNGEVSASIIDDPATDGYDWAVGFTRGGVEEVYEGWNHADSMDAAVAAAEASLADAKANGWGDDADTMDYTAGYRHGFTDAVREARTAASNASVRVVAADFEAAQNAVEDITSILQSNSNDVGDLSITIHVQAVNTITPDQKERLEGVAGVSRVYEQ